MSNKLTEDLRISELKYAKFHPNINAIVTYVDSS